MDLKIIEKPLFFLCFFNISRKSLEALGNALGDAWGSLGDAWGSLGDALGSLGDAMKSLGDALGGLGYAWGNPSGRNLGKTLEEPP